MGSRIEGMGLGNGNGHSPGDWEGLLRSKYKKPPPKMVREFFKEVAGGQAADLTKAARLAGYKSPVVMGSRLKGKFPDVFEAAEFAWRESCGVKPDELLLHLSEIVRDQDHKDRMKAIELNAKIHGMLTEKHVIELDRSKLLAAIQQKVDQLIEAKVLESGQVIEADAKLIPQDSSDFTE